MNRSKSQKSLPEKPEIIEIVLKKKDICDIMEKMFDVEVKTMKASHKKLWKLLVDKEMSKSDLHKKSGLSSSTMTNK